MPIFTPEQTIYAEVTKTSNNASLRFHKVTGEVNLPNGNTRLITTIHLPNADLSPGTYQMNGSITLKTTDRHQPGPQIINNETHFFILMRI